MSKISNEDRLLLLGYGSIALAYTILFFVKYKHLAHK
jgi:hypothetical protein